MLAPSYVGMAPPNEHESEIYIYYLGNLSIKKTMEEYNVNLLPSPNGRSPDTS